MNMSKGKLLIGMALLLAGTSPASARRVSYTVDVTRPFESSPSELKVKASQFLGYGYENQSQVLAALKSGKLTMQASHYLSSGKESFYKTNTATEGYGHWFAKSGLSTTKPANRAVCVTFDGEKFAVSHNTEANVSEGSTFTVRESFISTSSSDTLTYVFNIKVGGTVASVTSDQRTIPFGRKNYTDSWAVTPQVKENEQYWANRNYIQVAAGNSVTLSATQKEEGVTARYAWLDRKGKTIRNYKTTADLVLPNLNSNDAGMYTLKVRATDADNEVTVKEYNYFVDVQSNPGEFYDWTQNTAHFSYDFRTEYPNLEEPQKVHTFYKRTADGGTAPANCYAGKWWSIFWGDNLNPEVGTDSATVYAAAKHMVEVFDENFAYLRNRMGWPPDLSARSGYKSFIYIFGSGLTNDDVDQETMGGYQSATSADGQTWACVWASWYPFSRARTDKDFGDNDWQVNAMVHEGIHATLADMPGVKGSSWFHEAGNTWAQSKMAQLQAQDAGITEESDDATAGWLDCAQFLAPFMPIECYSGWLQDGSFGGPQAQGVNKYNSEGTQICTWRNILGGTQYGNAFPTILSGFAGNGSVPWIWRNCDYRVLEGIGDSIGEDAMRKIVLQYRSRMSIFDFGYGSKSYRNTTNNAFGQVIGPEYEPYYMDCGKWAMTPYVKPTINDDEGWLAPDTLTNPGWSGANFIPIHIDESADTICIDFRPEDTNMQAQLCYRTPDGTSYYSQPVCCGEMKLDITNRPANGVVICVVANTDYIYDDDNGEWQRSHHWDYRIRLGKGATAVADPYQKWFFHEREITDPNYDATGIKDITGNGSAPTLNYRKGIYNLQGQKLTSMAKGFYIVDGNKVLVK
jgi:hypothetical protein